MAIGNIIGSNIANIFLILGLSSIFYALGLEGREISKQFKFHLVLSLILAGIIYFGIVNIITTLVLSIFMAVYFYLNLSANQLEEIEKTDVDKIDYVKILIGFALLYGSGELLVFSGANLGREWGVSEFAISAIFVAFGTSFPELVTALLACYRKKDTNLVIGNVIGSNIFNGAFVLGSIGFYNFKLEALFVKEVSALVLVSIFFLLFNFF